jgi:hypothetical protein
MKRNILIGAVVLLAGPLLAADAKDDITAAAKKLAAKSNYSWKTTADFGPNSPFTPGPTEGKTEKDGLTWLSTSFQDNTMEAVMKGTNNVVVKTDEGWKKADEVTGGGGGGGGNFNFGAIIAGQMQRLRVPAAEVEDLVGRAKELKKDGDAFSGDLTEDGAKALLAFRGRRGGGAAPTNAKASVKFWVKDGEITKYQTKATGKRQNQNGEETDIERTTTVEIKDVGTTKINVPDEAKKKLS